jgi:crotonobetainyl-CoA:carnitine CoA-transferase CaiB-like acyl-CoA transferase
LIDKVTAGFVTQSVLAALFHRERTNRGIRIDINMLDAAAYFNFPDMFEHRTVVDDPADRALPEPRSVHDVVKTADGFLIVAPGTAAHLERACAAVGHREWYDDFRQLKSFAAIGPMLNERLEGEFVETSTAEAVRLLVEHDVPACEVLDLDGHLNEPQVVHNGTYGVLEHEVLGRHRFAHFPARFTLVGEEQACRAEVHRYPDLDEHGQAIRAARTHDGALDEERVWTWP